VIWRREDRRDGYVAIPDAPEEVGGMAEQGSELTVVGAGARLDGTVVSTGSLRVDGQVKGRISADGDVTLSGQSQVEADITARNVSVGGRFSGDIVARGRAAITPTGRVEGSITSKTLLIEEGASFRGESRMEGAAAPSIRPQQPESQAVQEAKV
jgi:cytoskeletal protein CcmA (bactofilin family)